MTKQGPSTDYDTYAQIMGELLQPIAQDGLEPETLKRLYESKMVYLENLRVKCFRALNSERKGLFKMEDYHLILKASKETQAHLRDLILLTVTNHLARRKAS